MQQRERSRACEGCETHEQTGETAEGQHDTQQRKTAHMTEIARAVRTASNFESDDRSLILSAHI
jgi:hypothetical protein